MNESHITVITPPEGRANFFPGSVGIDKVLSIKELINKYKSTLKKSKFKIICVGMQKNTEGNIVFYLVVKSKDIIKIRKEIAEVVLEKDSTIPFEPVEKYNPHIRLVM